LQGNNFTGNLHVFQNQSGQKETRQVIIDDKNLPETAHRFYHKSQAGGFGLFAFFRTKVLPECQKSDTGFISAAALSAHGCTDALSDTGQQRFYPDYKGQLPWE
jgi:hypothetical protein